jgi:hypothetical protein
MECDARPVIEQPTPSDASGPVGVLAPIVSAGMLHEGEALLCLRPATSARYEAKVVNGGIQLPDGRWFKAPSGALSALGFHHQNGWHYWLRARDGAPLSRLRITAPAQTTTRDPARKKVQVKALLTDGSLHPGDELRFARPYLGVVHAARVLADGQLQLGDGHCYPTPAAAVAAVTDGKVTDGWGSWRRVQDDRTLAELRHDHLSRRASTRPSNEPVAAPSTNND